MRGWTVVLVAGLALASACERAPDRPKIVVLGFDGAGWDTIEPLLDAGELPYLAELRERSAWGPLHTFKPTKSPVIWTSIATGKTMAKHGILDFVFLEENDIQVPYSNSERREPSIWQILDRFGRRSVVVNWFVTYPPDVIDGVMVSNRFRKAILLSESRRRGMEDTVYPPERFPELLPFISLDYDDLRRERGLPHLPDVFARLHPEEPLEEQPVLKDYWIYVLQEALVENVAWHLFETEEADLFAAYFRLPDIVQHTALALLEPELVEATLSSLAAGTLTEEERARFDQALAEVLLPFYRYMESILKRYVEAAGEDAYVMLLSDHGFALQPSGYDHYQVPDDEPAPSGIFLLSGPGVRRGRTPSLSVYDVAPTMLYLYDLPIGENMDGRPAEALFSFERPLRYERYSRDLMETRESERDEEIDEKTLEELRSLGYIP